ncbi:NAD-dependent epimerase/dehydratase family protein [Mesorhizobium sp.]|uniref:polysaccharide biosynthesis C-terminal domain-containing protein n=1 Tax=Mesorhizobium sp. TaxID=1871066 RepID=UPI000FE7502D|nr:NAD-dependent epimerase/dehydratase family protein [Mesorhizobium sp.]RWP38395.1 MAG: NAD-dependent epimerase/dehydratase family protein [Mesorhizobium sp.]
MKVVVTGASGLVGWHTAARLHARNCAARYKEETAPFDVVLLDHAGFSNAERLRHALTGASAVLHFAGVNRAADEEVESANPAIAKTLIAASHEVGVAPHIVYANSTHAASDTTYGRSKRRAGEILAAGPGGFTNLILPHIFGEGARPRYNNVTATFVEQIIRGEQPQVNPDGRVQLLHAGAAAEAAIAAVLDGAFGDVTPAPRPFAVGDLLSKLQGFHAAYSADIFPDLSDPFDLTLFNSYRAALYPQGFPRVLRLNTDPRGILFEAVKGGGGGQTFLSWTVPGVTRGNHFHLSKVERFLVLDGEATIRVRRVMGGPVWEFQVNGKTPAPVDMPTLHTHSIENTGDRPLLTLFWTHELFDPASPDTFADRV